MKYVLVSILIVLLHPLSYSQQGTSQQEIGKTHTTIVRGYYNVTIVYHRNKQAIAVFLLPCDSLIGIVDFVESERKKYGDGVIATIERITYQKPGSKEIELDVSKYNKKDPEPVSKARQEIDSLKKLNFISGTIYFSGAGFTNVSSSNVVDKAKMGMYFGRTMPGTTITFENCIYKNSNGSLSQPLNRSIKLN